MASASPRRRPPWPLIALLGLAIVEWVAAARAYRTTIAPADWDAVADAIAGLPADEPVRIAEAWLEPSARMMLPALARPAAVAPPDLRSPARIHVLGAAGVEWSARLAADLEDRPHPRRSEAKTFGGLTLTTFVWDHAAPERGAWVDDMLTLTAAVDGRRCEGKRTRKCGAGRIRVRTVEVDYRPRRCVEIDIADGSTAVLTHPAMAMGTVLRGHVGWGNFNRRLRSDAPVDLSLSIDGNPVAHWLATDAEGWRPLAVAVPDAVGPTAVVELRVTVAAQGTWQRQGYQARKAHAVCIELRSLDEGGVR